MKNVVLRWFWPIFNFVQPRIDQSHFGQVDLKRHFKCFYALTGYTMSIYMYPWSPSEKLMSFWNFQGLAYKSRVDKIWYLQAAMWWCSSTPSHNLSLLHKVWLFQFFLNFWSDLYETIWRPFRALISSKFISLGSSGYLVSISSNFVKFGAMFIKILRLEGRWHSARNSITFFIKNLFIPIPGRYHRAFFVRGSWDTILQNGLAGLLQFLANRCSFLREVSPKIAYLTWKKKWNFN